MTIRSYWSAISVVLHHQEPVLARLRSIRKPMHRPRRGHGEAAALIQRPGTGIVIFDDQREPATAGLGAPRFGEIEQFAAHAPAPPRQVYREHGDEPVAGRFPFELEDRDQEGLDIL